MNKTLLSIAVAASFVLSGQAQAGAHAEIYADFPITVKNYANLNKNDLHYRQILFII